MNWCCATRARRTCRCAGSCWRRPVAAIRPRTIDDAGLCACRPGAWLAAAGRRAGRPPSSSRPRPALARSRPPSPRRAARMAAATALAAVWLAAPAAASEPASFSSAPGQGGAAHAVARPAAIRSCRRCRTRRPGARSCCRSSSTGSRSATAGCSSRRPTAAGRPAGPGRGLAGQDRRGAGAHLRGRALLPARRHCRAPPSRSTARGWRWRSRCRRASSSSSTADGSAGRAAAAGARHRRLPRLRPALPGRRRRRTEGVGGSGRARRLSTPATPRCPASCSRT